MECDQTQVQLTTGSRVDGKDALFDYAWLKDACCNFPEALQIAVEIAFGRPIPTAIPMDEKVAACAKKELIKDGILDGDGNVNETFRKVVLASVRMNPDGLVVSNPFRVQTQKDAECLNALLDSQDMLGVRATLDGVQFLPSRQ
jgi:hypothetical protein